jgi:hypothetical protein
MSGSRCTDFRTGVQLLPETWAQSFRMGSSLGVAGMCASLLHRFTVLLDLLNEFQQEQQQAFRDGLGLKTQNTF